VYSQNVKTSILKIDNNVIIDDTIDKYIKTNESSRIAIKCNKTVVKIGNLVATVNGIDAFTISCLKSSGSITTFDIEDPDCVTKLFLFNLNDLPEENNYFNIRCGLDYSTKKEDEDVLSLRRLCK
jgi:hypothetical protein